MPEFQSQAATDAGHDLDDFTKGYIMSMYFTDTGEDDQPDSEADLDPDALKRIIKDCDDFQSQSKYLDLALDTLGGSRDYSHAGHDFWLTRNGHGAGFWDGDWGAFGPDLTREARTYGEIYTYKTDTGEMALS